MRNLLEYPITLEEKLTILDKYIEIAAEQSKQHIGSIDALVLRAIKQELFFKE